MWQAFWLSGTWLGHIPFMSAAFCLLFLILFGYTASKDAERTRVVGEGIYGDAHIVRSPRELGRRNDFWDGTGTPARAGLVLGATAKGYWFDSSVPHALTCGKTGSGQDAAAGAGDHAARACGRLEHHLDRQARGP